MRALVTGLTGFTGKHLKTELEQNGYEVYGLYAIENGVPQRVDMLEYTKMYSVIERIMPDVVFHLAGISSAVRAWQNPPETFNVNIVGTANLLEILKRIVPKARILLVCSSQEYGTPPPECNTITEDIPFNPKTPYAVSKLAQEYVGRLYNEAYSMNVCIARTFMLVGPGEKKGSMFADFASGIAAVEAGISDKLSVGNLDSARDFLHVRDAVRAYRMIVEMGFPGEVYNVGSGECHTAREVLDKLLNLAYCDVPVEQSIAKKRILDIKAAPCNYDKLYSQTGWFPSFSFEQLVEEELEDWRIRTRKAIEEGHEIR